MTEQTRTHTEQQQHRAAERPGLGPRYDAAPSRLTRSQADILALQRAAGNWAVSQLLQSGSGNIGTIQPKLIVGQPGDRYEQEADQVAGQVMRVSEPRMQRQVELEEEEEEEEEEMLRAKPLAEQITPSVQRQPIEEEEEDEKELLLTSQDAGQTPELTPELESRIEVLRGSGQALDSGVRAQMELAFGADFDGVRVHADAEADTLNRSLSARAFTTGQDIFFRQGAYNPGNSSGRDLLAHELTHVVQQARGARPRLAIGQPGDRYEQEAAQAVNARAFTTRRDIAFGVGQYTREAPSGGQSLTPKLMHVVHQMTTQDRIQTHPAPNSTGKSSTGDVPSSTPSVPPFEAVTGTTAAEMGRLELLTRAKKLWTRYRMSFTKAARRHAGKKKVPKGEPRAAQSPRIKPLQPYELRWCLNIFVWDYRGRKRDLPYLRDLMKPGSPLRKSMRRGFHKVIPVKNLAGHEIYAKILDTIIELHRQLKPSRVGQLVVVFSGHGGGGNIQGWDEQEVTKEQLARLASIFAGGLGIHMVYILDTCQADQLADLARQQALESIEKRVPGLPETAKKKIKEPLGPLETVKTLHEDKVRLGEPVDWVCNFADWYVTYARKYRYCRRMWKQAWTAGNKPEARKWKGRMQKHAGEMAWHRTKLTSGHRMKKLLAELRVLWKDELMLPSVPQIHSKRLEEAQEYVRRVQRWQTPIADNIRRMKRRLGVLLDTLGDLINELIMKLREETAPAKKKPSP
jgi:hypothetical protein